MGAIDDGAGVGHHDGSGASSSGSSDAEAAAHHPRGAVRQRGIRHVGLAGLRSRANQADAERHVLGFEADFGAGPVWRLSSRVNPAQLPVVEQIFRALAPLKLARGNNEATGGADLDGLAKQGMAILSPDLDGTNYFDVHHTANDTLAQVDPAALRQSVAAYAMSAWLGAQYPGELAAGDDGQAAAALSVAAAESSRSCGSRREATEPARRRGIEAPRGAPRVHSVSSGQKPLAAAATTKSAPCVRAARPAARP